jgi:hypothetical protein
MRYNEPQMMCPMDMSPSSIACRESRRSNNYQGIVDPERGIGYRRLPRVGYPQNIGFGGANWGKSPVSSSPTTSKNLGIKNINRTIESADQTFKEVKGVTAGLKNFLNNFGETGQGYSNWLTSVGLGRVPRGRSGMLMSPAPGFATLFGFKGNARPRARPRPSFGSFADNTNAIANLIDSGIGVANLVSANGKSRQKKRGKGWDFNGLLNELRPDSYMRSTWLPNAAAASQGAAALTGIFGPEAVVASEEALAPLTYAALMNELLKSQGYGKSGKSRKSGNDGRAARAAIVRKVMQQRGVSLPMASKIVKQEGLY